MAGARERGPESTVQALRPEGRIWFPSPATPSGYCTPRYKGRIACARGAVAVAVGRRQSRGGRAAARPYVNYDAHGPVQGHGPYVTLAAADVNRYSGAYVAVTIACDQSM